MASTNVRIALAYIVRQILIMVWTASKGTDLIYCLCQLRQCPYDLHTRQALFHILQFLRFPLSSPIILILPYSYILPLRQRQNVQLIVQYQAVRTRP